MQHEEDCAFLDWNTEQQMLEESWLHYLQQSDTVLLNRDMGDVRLQEKFRRKQMDRRKMVLSEQILRNHFGKKYKKQKANAYKQTPEYSEEIRLAMEIDPEYLRVRYIQNWNEALWERFRGYVKNHRKFLDDVQQNHMTAELWNLTGLFCDGIPYADYLALVEERILAEWEELLIPLLESEHLWMNSPDSEPEGKRPVKGMGSRSREKDRAMDFVAAVTDTDFLRKAAFPDDGGLENFCFAIVLEQFGLYDYLPFYDGVLDENLIGLVQDDIYNRFLREQESFDRLTIKMSSRFPQQRLLNYLAVNPYYGHLVRAYEEKLAQDKAMRAMVMEQMPERVIDLYPLARATKRHFVLHVGPTNSGKSYTALQRLKEGETGVYLAPLRLLALEKYEELNRAGCYCSMLTGEEKIMVPGSTHISATIEMLDLNRYYDIAVIDECQMIADPSRGGKWTQAILGIYAGEIHLCLAPEAEKMIRAMIASCGDTLEVVNHERFTELEMEQNEISFPEDCQPGDAYIVFSRRMVHICAAELQSRGINCSVIYGALPYDVRRKEAEKFAAGENPVVVSTDAIGMGLNLPIRRVVFLEAYKFDGFRQRQISNTEVKQIAGRAGRYGFHEKGYVNAVINVHHIRKMLKRPVPKIKKAVLGFPETLLSVEMSLSETYEKWNELADEELYEKADVEETLGLIRTLETISDDKALIYSFATIPFDPDNEDVYEIWLDAFRHIVAGEPPELEKVLANVHATSEEMADSLDTLERMYKICDLLFSISERRKDEAMATQVLQEKRRISDRMIAILSEQKLARKQCKNCGTELSWNYPYSLCRKCYRMKQRR